jgi:hypothetical protein
MHPSPVINSALSPGTDGFSPSGRPLQKLCFALLCVALLCWAFAFVFCFALPLLLLFEVTF